MTRRPDCWDGTTRRLIAGGAWAAAAAVAGLSLGCASRPAEPGGSAGAGGASAGERSAVGGEREPGRAGSWTEAERKLSLMEQALLNSEISLEGLEPGAGGSAGGGDAAAAGRTGGSGTDRAGSRAGDGGEGGVVEPARTNTGRTVTVDDPRPGVSARPEPSPSEAFARPARSERSAPAPPIGVRIGRQVHELAGLLRMEADASGYDLPAHVKVAALDVVEPGTLNSHFIGAADPGSDAALTGPERRFVTAWRDLHAEVWREVERGDVVRLAELVREHAEGLRLLVPMTIRRAALCTRVEGFGVYDELRSFETPEGEVYKLLAGRPHRLIVYVELDNFRSEEASERGVSGHRVELTQELALYHLGRDADLRAWQMPPQRITDFSRNERRDFFVVQIIDLPETLSVDRYALKVRLTDGSTRAEAETVIRVDVVADTSVFTGSR